MFLVLKITNQSLQSQSRSLILAGIMFSLFCGALVVTGLSLLSPEKMQAAMFWLMGEFGTPRDKWIYWALPLQTLLCTLILWRANALDALSLGDSRALSLGFSPTKERNFFIITVALLTALSVSICGLVGFIGLVSAHIARLLIKKSSHFNLGLATLLTGALLLVVADSLGRIVGPTEVPAGSLSAILGAPLLIFLLMRSRYAQVE